MSSQPLRQATRARSAFGVLAAPYVVGLLLLVVLPTVAAVGLAFTEYYGFEAPRFVGWDNFRRAAEDELFRTSLRNVALIALVAVPLRLVLATGAALLLHGAGRLVPTGRVSAYLPSVVPDAAWALLWLWLLNPLYGPLPAALRAVGLDSPSFLTDPAAARLGIALLVAFQVGEAFVVALAARSAIPGRLYEAAAVEGAPASHVVRRVTLPLMAPLLALLAVRDVVLLLQVTFVPVLLVTEGGPRDATLTPPLYLYQRAFLYGELGYASALSVVLLLLTAAALVLQLAVLRRLMR
jgi:multiple sugar transport system permease protein